MTALNFRKPRRRKVQAIFAGALFRFMPVVWVAEFGVGWLLRCQKIRKAVMMPPAKMPMAATQLLATSCIVPLSA